jgi:phosphoribosylpyrophosphate synthetase
MQTVINESVRGAYVFFIQSSFPPSDNLFELLLFIDAAKRHRRDISLPLSLILVMPGKTVKISHVCRLQS